MVRSVIDKDQLTAEAAEWIARLNGQKVGNATRGHFILWLMRSYKHVEAFLAASRVFGEVRYVQALPPKEDLVLRGREETGHANVVPLRDTDITALQPVELESERRVSRSWVKYAAAASGVFVLVALGWLAYHVANRPAVVHTHVGEQRSVVLEDGTAVYLNTDTTISAKLSPKDRRIVLVHGEARFIVAKDPTRPFHVMTPQAEVMALGTAFNVRIMDGRTVVSVIEGHIKVVKRADQPATRRSSSLPEKEGPTKSPLDLFANEQVLVTEHGPMIARGGPPFDRAVGWTQRRIVFHDEPLSVLATEFNRYNKQPLEIADPDLAQHKIDGGFDAFDRASLLDYLQRYQGVRIDEENGKLLMRRAAAPSEDR